MEEAFGGPLFFGGGGEGFSASINYLALLAVWFGKNITHAHKVLTDNTTAVAYVNNQENEEDIMSTDRPPNVNTKGYEAARIRKMKRIAMVETSRVDCELYPRTVHFSNNKCVPRTEGQDVADCFAEDHIPICLSSNCETEIL